MPDLSLAGDWTLVDGDGAEVGPCALPGDIHSALIAAGRITDPMAGLAEADCQWVGDMAWELRRTVRLTAAELKGKWPVLDLDRVDTFCDVIVNGREVASLGSCFIRHRIDLTGQLVPGDNDLVLRFRPAAKEAHERATLQPFPVPWSVMNNRVADMNMIRKPQCHAGWDWGPCLMVAGVYAEPRLRLFEAARIEHAVIRQAHGDDGRVTVTAEVELAARETATVPVTFTFGGETATAAVAVSPVDGGRVALSVEVSDPPLWWPAGHGPQHLAGAVVSIPGDRVVRKIGLRRIELVNGPDAKGISMAFRVDGVDV
ncbi:MAG TPA: glycoside hydrolase family 2 protein, partial [Bauldia sp.]|nr:glycoside hydrolase family 2 protein [Bauldia sp.]